MSRTAKTETGRITALARPWLFPLVVASLYGLGLVLAPEKTGLALDAGGAILRQVAGPLGLALVMMVLLNRLLSPALAARWMGRGAGIKGFVLSSLAGVLSMGPIYAWYPLLAALKEKGGSTFHVANFMGCRAVKPVLVPVLVGYFGWAFAAWFVAASFAAALVVAGTVGLAEALSPGRDVPGGDRPGGHVGGP